MKDFLFDADAFICIRKLSFLRLLAGGNRPWHMTGYIARHELSTVAEDIDGLGKSGHLQVHDRSARDPRFRELIQRGYDKGEAEAIAWAMDLPRDQRPTFISLDKRALKAAGENGVPAGDVMDLIVESIESGEITVEAAREKVAIWDDKHQVQGKPQDYTTFDETLARRRQTRSVRQE